MPVPSAQTLGVLFALGCALGWALTSLLVRTLSPALGTVAINTVRSAVAGAFLLALVLLREGAGGLLMSPGAFAALAASIVVALVVGDTVFFESARVLGLARAMTVSMTYPLIAALLAAALLGEALTLATAAGSLLTLGGLALIVRARGEEVKAVDRYWLGLGGAILASVAWAVSVILLKAPLREVDPVTAQAVRLPVAAAVLWATPWARGTLPRIAAGGASLRWRLLGLGGLTAVSSVMFVAALKYAGVTFATVLASTSPMFAIPLGFLFLGERLSASAVVGAAVTVTGIAVLHL